MFTKDEVVAVQDAKIRARFVSALPDSAKPWRFEQFDGSIYLANADHGLFTINSLGGLQRVEPKL